MCPGNPIILLYIHLFSCHPRWNFIVYNLSSNFQYLLDHLHSWMMALISTLWKNIQVIRKELPNIANHTSTQLSSPTRGLPSLFMSKAKSSTCLVTIHIFSTVQCIAPAIILLPTAWFYLPTQWFSLNINMLFILRMSTFLTKYYVISCFLLCNKIPLSAIPFCPS